MVPRSLLLALLAALLLPSLVSCGSTPEAVVLDVRSDPVGAEVYLSRRGQRAYKGKLGPVNGDVKSEEISEDFALIGHAPLKYESLLEEKESGGTVMGVGVKVVLKYREGVVRVVKDGYETVERKVRFKDGKVKVVVELEETGNAGAGASDVPAIE